MAQDSERAEQIESEWEAAPAVGVVIAGQLILALLSREEHWQLVGLGWWIWLALAIPELMLLVPLAWHLPRRRLEQRGLRRAASLSLIGLISVANGALICMLVTSLLRGDEHSGPELLAKAATVWGTNVVAFGLWFWGFDRGGPARRQQPNEPPPDFQFPQMENPQLAAPGWHPQLIDYIYVSFTNSIAFSPTDALPLTSRAKVLMGLESVAALVTSLLVIARAVNILH
jgi:MFS family permease